MEVIQWHDTSETPEILPQTSQPEYSHVKNQVTSIAELQKGSLIRLYRGLHDPKHRYSIEELEDRPAYGPTLKITGFTKEETSSGEIPVLQAQDLKNNFQRRIPLHLFSVVPLPGEKGFNPVNAVQLLQQNL